MSDLSKLIGERIRKNRKAQHLSQKELAERSGFHPAYIGQLERGEKNATLDSVQGICAGLGIPMEQLFVGAGKCGRKHPDAEPDQCAARQYGHAGTPCRI